MHPTYRLDRKSPKAMGNLFKMIKVGGFFQPPPVHSGSAVLDRHQIYILPTRSGFLFAFILLIMLIAAMNYNNSMAYLVTFWLGSMALVSTLHTQRTLLGLRIEIGKVAPVFAGETAQFELWLNNYGQPARHALVWRPSRKKFSWWPPTIETATELTTEIPANQRISLIIPIATMQRGPLFLGPLTVTTRFPLGLFQAWSHVHLAISTLVYPQPIGHQILPTSQNSENAGEGHPQWGGGEDFIGHRNYQRGDSPRQVDWKAVAREQPWLIKQFGGMGVARVWLSWENVNHYNDLELALAQLCLWILVAESQGAQYGLEIPGTTLEPDTGEYHRERCLRALTLYGNSSCTHLGQL